MPLAVIPWFELPSFSLGPYFTIQSFGILSAIGILVAVQLAAKGARELGKDPQVILDFSVAGVLSGVLFGHLVHLLFYHQEELQDPIRVLKFWEGLSSMGGLLGGILAAAVFFRRRKIRFADYADAFALGVAPGWGIARVGCFTVHDHPGIHSDFFLAVNWNDGGGPRHDLGLYEAIALFAMGALLWILHRRGLLRGRLLSLLALLYGVTRFFLDFLRARPGDVPYADGRQWGLTFAQWFCVLLVANGVRGLVARRPAAAPPVRRSTASVGG
ncbi:prolipoprotein diacylglyceryl transferase [Anaeromyxobacter oryzisoli]|jgi:phosphatidylglycerol---prolipoprotein diacylglyceryl transferase|uniref:prolipoprotein diacylglyceryl transferase n=1 Tax=Anaeromyxobacter oryzisoli TaxID=2925408 RepID=UPI001F5A376D|nr:prolipoprotein diacylglyceryl transferase family protein [Anaeromyxobacter sp. SG63]